MLKNKSAYRYQVQRRRRNDEIWDGVWDDWNVMCAWVIEEFGLVGKNYIVDLNEESIIFKFKEKEHAMITALRWGNDNV